MVPADGAVRLTVGGRLVGAVGAVGAGAAFTRIDTASERVESPLVSYATAVTEYVPAATLLHVALNGPFVSVPMSVEPA